MIQDEIIHILEVSIFLHMLSREMCLTSFNDIKEVNFPNLMKIIMKRHFVCVLVGGGKGMLVSQLLADIQECKCLS